MDTLTLRALWLAAVDAPLAPALGLLTGAGLALLGLGAVLAAVAWVRFLLTPGDPPEAGPGGAGASLLAWRAGRLGLGALALALGGRAVALAAAPGPDVTAALWCALGAVVLVWARGAWALWAAVLPLAPVPRTPRRLRRAPDRRGDHPVGPGGGRRGDHAHTQVAACRGGRGRPPAGAAHPPDAGRVTLAESSGRRPAAPAPRTRAPRGRARNGFAPGPGRHGGERNPER